MAKEPFAAKLTSIWIGGFFFWIIKGFKGSISDQYIQAYENRNVWTGYILMLLFAGIIGYFIFKN
ncbi:hypothetical protein [Flavobacterium johnsoniae]|uniref:hypothetical protein n=1 Tax=Flavobacterium johnsoniae TaxID=986 RepID=UPI0005C6523C|nr:hypothetical protein [Flavobacterium johnsoniae]OXE99915.1 hypothetical protein B0A63_11490 [Flavobacterium johnsoniae UW101]WQG82433.1 hypothetical protein SR927_04795 [Flavobacterium johnsoniae UW101]SHM01128.1 hypothetical protein SAMN05444146_5170 [Flavobacterium johnsoniae]